MGARWARMLLLFSRTDIERKKKWKEQLQLIMNNPPNVIMSYAI